MQSAGFSHGSLAARSPCKRLDWTMRRPHQRHITRAAMPATKELNEVPEQN